MGHPPVAAAFRDRFDIPFPLLVDHDRETYRAVEAKRGSWLEVLGPPVWLRYVKGLARGRGVALAKQDVLQMGGVVVVAKGGEVTYVHRSQTSADNPSVERVLAAIP
jgi:peroxiredoxin